MDLLIATRNRGKTEEFRQLFGNAVRITDLSEHPEIPEIAETGATFFDNARLKAVAVSQQIGETVLADDSGLEVDILDGAPGVFSARYAGEPANAKNNIEKLLDELAFKDPTCSKRTARFHCALVVARKGEVIDSAGGIVEGRITDLPRGSGGFGYDPVFRPLGYPQTFAELSPAVKNAISHRARAVNALRRKLKL